MKKINLEEILNKHHHLYMAYSVKDTEGKFRRVIDQDGAIEAMKEAVKQALELAAENATWSHTGVFIQNAEGNFYSGKGLFVRKDSILNTINQIE